MSPLLSVFALIFVAGLVALLHAVRSAPEGHEDQAGFNYDNKNEIEANTELCLIPVPRR